MAQKEDILKVFLWILIYKVDAKGHVDCFILFSLKGDIKML